jgi:hypothetical protein
VRATVLADAALVADGTKRDDAAMAAVVRHGLVLMRRTTDTEVGTTSIEDIKMNAQIGRSMAGPPHME